VIVIVRQKPTKSPLPHQLHHYCQLSRRILTVFLQGSQMDIVRYRETLSVPIRFANTFKDLVRHTEIHHECPTCGNCFRELDHHWCQYEISGSGKTHPRFSKENLDPGRFTLTQVGHKGAIFIYKHRSPIEFQISNRPYRITIQTSSN
jgi:hypothetical protein